MAVRVETLGGLRIFRDGEELTSLLGKPVQCALLVYLALERESTRDELMGLIWPEKEPTRARGSLNNTVYELRSVLGPEWVATVGDHLRIADDVDADARWIEGTDGESLAARGQARWSFLRGVHLVQTREFEEWVEQRRDRVARHRRRAAEELIRTRYTSAGPRSALPVARDWAEHRPYDEEANYWLIRLAAETGQPSEALRIFDAYADRMARDLDARPGALVREVEQQVREGRLSPSPERLADVAPEPRRRPPPGATTGPDRAWRPAPGAGRKLIKLLGGYAAVSAGILQGIAMLLDYYPALPRTFFDAALALTLCGLPMVVVTAFLQGQPVTSRDLGGLRFFAARWFTWRNAALGAIAAAAAWGAAATGWIIVGPALLQPRLDENLVMVFPLAATSAIADPLAGWDVALAIGAALEHTEPLRFIDGRDWLDEPYRSDPSALTPDLASAVAASRGAGYYIDGVVMAVGDSTSVILRVNDVAGDSLVTRETTAGLSAEASAPGLALEGVRSVLVRMVEPSQAENVAAFADRRPASTALFLQGERAFRESRFSEAYLLYERAIEEDPAHAFAAIRGAQAAAWTTDADAAVRLSALALANEALLPRKYQRLAHGFTRHLNGDADGAKLAFLEALSIDSAWSEAEMAIGDTYFHLLPSDATNPDSIADYWFRRAMEHDPDFSPPISHRLEILLRNGDVGEAAELVERWRTFEPDAVLLREVELALACVADPRRHRWPVTEEEVQPTLMAALGLAGRAAHPECARGAFAAAFAHSDELGVRWTALKGLVGLGMARARYAEVDSLIEAGIRTGVSASMTLYVHAALLGAPFHAEAANAERLLREATGDTFAGSPAQWRWLMGIWLARSGEVERLEAIHSAMVDEASASGDRSIQLIADALRAHLLAARGDTAAAIGTLQTLAPSAKSALIEFSEPESLGHERLLLAELLLATGDEEGALHAASLLDHHAPDLYPLYLRRSLELRLQAAGRMQLTRTVQDLTDRLSDLSRAGGEAATPTPP